MTPKLTKAYEPQSIEHAIYQRWERSGFFNPDKLPEKRTKIFSIAMPPPNVTGELHLGHATGMTLEDIMIRFRRMQGYSTLWVPGTDHAGISTQIMVERLIAEQGVNRHQLGRAKFLKHVWAWKKKYGTRITEQIRQIGASCDWSREHFTMDPTLTAAVQKAFVTLYNDGLIYRGNRIIHWCPRCASAISDLEVKYEQREEKLYYLRYPLMGSTKYITVATTRPETMLGDTAVAVHPDDTRYQALIGQTVVLPIMEREIPVIADKHVEREFGTGAVKVTPAHDHLDYEIGQRHKLPLISVIDEKEKMTKEAGKFYGKHIHEARRLIMEDLEAEGHVEKVETYTHNIATCDRCHSVIQPLISKQWFVKTKPLAEKAIAAVRSGKITIVPKRFEKVYFHWMNNIHDWCISRQLWWGHQIPVWYCGQPSSGLPKRMGFYTKVVPQIYQGKTKTYRLRDHGFVVGDIVQFENSQTRDVIGMGKITEVSSTTVGKLPLNDRAHGATYTHRSQLIQALRKHYPHRSITERTRAFIYEYAFSPAEKPTGGCGAVTVSIDKPRRCPTCGQSKHLRQDPDTLDTWFSSGLWTFSTLGWPKKTKDLKRFHPTSVMETGWDILFFWVARMTMLSLYLVKEVPFKTVYLHGLVLDREGRKMSKSKGTGIDPIPMTHKYGTDAIRLSLVLGTTAGQDTRLYEEKIAGYRNFINKLWNIARFALSVPAEKQIKARTLADRWILSRSTTVIKETTRALEEYRFSDAGTMLYEFVWHELADWYIEVAKISPNGGVLHHTLNEVLKLLHPFAPFVTEAIWGDLYKQKSAKDMLMVASWPTVKKVFTDKKAEQEFEIVKQVTTALRNARSNAKVPPSEVLKATFWGSHKQLIREQLSAINRLARVQLSEGSPQGGATFSVAGVSCALSLSREVLGMLQAERASLDAYIARLTAQLDNQAFVKNAPQQVVDDVRAKLKDAMERRKGLR